MDDSQSEDFDGGIFRSGYCVMVWVLCVCVCVCFFWGEEKKKCDL